METAFENAVTHCLTTPRWHAVRSKPISAPWWSSTFRKDCCRRSFRKSNWSAIPSLLIRAAGILKIPALVSTQYAKGLGGTVPEIASLLPGTEAIDKTLFSCFGSDVFCQPAQAPARPAHHSAAVRHGKPHLRRRRPRSARLREGYLVHVASDAVSSRTEWNWKIGLDRMRAAGAVISSTEMMIYELMRSSSSAAFKELLPHLEGIMTATPASVASTACSASFFFTLHEPRDLREAFLETTAASAWPPCAASRLPEPRDRAADGARCTPPAARRRTRRGPRSCNLWPA